MPMFHKLVGFKKVVSSFAQHHRCYGHFQCSHFKNFIINSFSKVQHAAKSPQRSAICCKVVGFKSGVQLCATPPLLWAFWVFKFVNLHNYIFCKVLVGAEKNDHKNMQWKSFGKKPGSENGLLVVKTKHGKHSNQKTKIQNMLYEFLTIPTMETTTFDPSRQKCPEAMQFEKFPFILLLF